MELSGMVEALHDNSNKLIIFKAYVPLIGLKATALLSCISSGIDEHAQLLKDEDGTVWYRQTIQWMARQSALSESGLRRAKKTLLDLDLIYVKQDVSYDRTTLWRLNREKLSRLFAFAHALYAATAPDNTNTLHRWIDFAENHPDIVEEFRPLYPRLNQYMTQPPARSAPEPESEPEPESVSEPEPEPEANSKNRGLKLREHDLFKNIPAKQVKPCRFVEFWNTLPDVPKCKIGTATYEQARRFFAAHQRYEAGNCANFFLTTDEQERIKLEKINRIPPDAPRRGPRKTAIRPDEQMFRHIELAARVYQKEYAPQNKKFLPKSLPQFLFNNFSKRHGICSMFLERIGIFRPQLLDEVSRDAIVANASEEELLTVQVLKRLFDEANRRDEDQELSLRDLKAALSAARTILDKYEEIPVTQVSIFASHFGFYNQFLEWFEQFAEDHLWEGMPMSAFHPSKDLWRRFVDFVSADVGYDLFTGERV